MEIISDLKTDIPNSDGQNSQEIVEFISKLIVRFSEGVEFSTQLPMVLEAVGEYLGAQRITLSLTEGSSTQEISWVNNQYYGADDIQVFHAWLKKSGSENAIKFYVAGSNEQKESLYILIAMLIDSNLAAGKILHTEQSQRLLAESINQISKILTSTLDRNELLSLFLDQLETLVPYDSANVMVLKNGLLYMHAARGYPDFEGPVDISKIAFIPNETFLMDEVLKGTRPVILPDTRKSPQWTWAPCGEHIRSWMGVPLLVNDTVIGLFSIDKSTPNFFTEKHAQLASALAKHAALALDNALLFAQLQDAHEELRGLSAKIIEAQEKERQKIAIELHDHAGQALLALRAELQVLRHHLNKDPQKTIGQIDYFDKIVLELNRDLEQLAFDLRPPVLSTFGLISALEQYIQAFGKRLKITAEFNHDQGIPRFSEDIELVCYRIVQEALTNFAKHAKADYVEITINYFANELYLVVKDKGVGFEDHSPHSKRGFGLLGIRERLSPINGSLEINTNPGQGTELVVRIPVAGLEISDV